VRRHRDDTALHARELAIGDGKYQSNSSSLRASPGRYIEIRPLKQEGIMANKARGLRRFAAVGALAGALMVPMTGVAAASQNGTIPGGASRTFHTNFWGRTEVCVTNLGSQGNEPFYWISGPSGAPGNVNPGQTTCFTRSFVGFNITITNESGNALQVTFPVGP
jgi:hypothetical protein